MEFLLLSLALFPFVSPKDPGPGLLRSKEAARRLACEHTTVEAAADEFPGRLSPRRPRGGYIERSVVVCRENWMRPGLRSAADEAVLGGLSDTASGLARDAGASFPELEGHTWLVEAHHPSEAVSAKVRFATQNALMEQGLAVSDRTPVLSAGDIDVLLRMAPSEAYGAACRRYSDNGTLREGQALLAVVQRDRRETLLHAGLCVDGRWTWLR